MTQLLYHSLNPPVEMLDESALTKFLVYVIILSIICCATYTGIIKLGPLLSECFQSIGPPKHNS